MASSIASARPSLSVSASHDESASDPFVAAASSTVHHRFSDFDYELFAAGPGSSPRQAKRALEAHLAETERRLDEAGKLGTALVSQRKVLAEQLQEVDKLQTQGELGPQLRQKLLEIEREYNDLARESARAFLPKRIPSTENGPATPYAPDGRTGRRSISPSKFDGHATGSPSKITVPKRKARNQQSNRIHDIEFAAEISTSLIAQVRNLQALLSEREEEVKTLQGEKSRLEIDSESLHQRLKSLDESEHRYKDENWNLETRMQEMASLQKEALDKEKKLNHALGLANLEKTTAQKELDEVKASHAKLTEDFTAAVKLHDIEFGSAKRNLTLAEDERSALQKKIDDLISQNQELAQAYALQRGRPTDREVGSGMSDDDFDTATDHATPEHSPPPSPVKNTPRHAVLETETVKTSLGHAQRTIQSQRNQLHREKTEKLELRRIIQDLRDDLEKLRGDAGANVAGSRRHRRIDSKDQKRPSKLLGSMRSDRQDIFLDDPDWEENDGTSPTTGRSFVTRQTVLPTTEASDAFETANEASESAFETANERVTDADEIHVGRNIESDSDGAETETESRGFGRMQRPPSLPATLARVGHRKSFHSTASTSADEALDTLSDVRTPTGTVSSTRSRFSFSRLPWPRRSRQNSEEPNTHSSPVSHAGSHGTPRPMGQSLFAELQDLNGSEEESVGGTPRTLNKRSVTPGSTARSTLSPAPPMPARTAMVNHSTMTEPVSITDRPAVVILTRPTSSGSVINMNQLAKDGLSRHATETDREASPNSAIYNDFGVDHDQSMRNEIDQFPVPPTTVARRELAFSSILAQDMEPRDAAAVLRPTLKMSSISAENVEPIASPKAPKPLMSLGPIYTQAVEPVQPPTPTSPKASASVLAPKPVPVSATVPKLSLSSITAQDILPTSLPRPDLGFSAIATERVSPVSEPMPALGLSSVMSEHTRPVIPVVKLPTLSLSSILSESIAPKSTPKSSPVLEFSAVQCVDTEPQMPLSERRSDLMLLSDLDMAQTLDSDPETPNNKNLASLRGFGRSRDASPVIAEDETRQSLSDSPNAETPESQRPFKEISTNIFVRPSRKMSLQNTSDQGAQTTLTGGAIDRMVQTQHGHQKSPSNVSAGSPGTTGTVRIYRSQESLASHAYRGIDLDDSVFDAGSVIVRPESVASGKQPAYEAVPPLPSNHRQAIQAASSQGQGSMGPPLWPASAMKRRPSTPSKRRRSGSVQDFTPTPRAAQTSALVDFQRKPAMVERQPSISSFASDIDARFDLHHAVHMDSTGFGPNTDPRMIQAITQTMIGEFLWKYTRKTGRGELSANRHRRYFWVHPYTRTLYWGDQDPSSAKRSMLRAKSVPIEAVRVVTDDNPLPPGLHRKSLVVIAPGRTIKFTCPTGQRHETWFNALSYLLVRTEPQATYDAEDVAGNITREDVDEFNPQFGRRPTNGNRPEQQSLLSYNSRTRRNESPAEVISMAMPTLTPTPHRNALANRSSRNTLTKISGYWKLPSLRGRAGGSNTDLYATNQVHDSAEDLREIIERQDRDADRLENVRACCDGKHDVSSVRHSSKRTRHSHGHAHPANSTSTTPVLST